MNTNSLTSIVALATVAAASNIAPFIGQTVAPAGNMGQSCTVTAADKNPMIGADKLGATFNPWMTPQTFDPMSGGCDGCQLSDTIVETYCESRAHYDCDGVLGWNESFNWTREKYIYQCGTPGQPDYGWYVDCSIWALDGCCNNGTPGLPPTSCGYQGASSCSNRSPG